MSNKHNIYAKSEEQFVKTVMLYSDGTQLFYDEDLDEPVLAADLMELFLKGFCVYIGDIIVARPVSCDPDGSCITIINTSGNTSVIYAGDVEINLPG